MGKRTKAENARCPWYCSETPQKIYCTGLEELSWIHYSFQAQKDCRRYKNKYCKDGWESCPIAKLHGEEENMSKYHAEPIIINGTRYDSRKEAARHQELILLERAGKISDLKYHEKFELIPRMWHDEYGKTEPGKGKAVQPAYYEADFTYIDTATGRKIVEDVKGFKTDMYKRNKKMMLWLYGIWIKET